MNFEASDKPKFCGNDDDESLPVSREDFESEDDDDDDDIPLSQMIPSLGKCSSECDGSVKKRDFEFDNTNSLHISVKKSKVSVHHDHNEDEDNIPLSDMFKRPSKSTDKSCSSLKKDPALLEKAFEECKELKIKEIELNQVKGNISKEVEPCQVIDNIDKDRERKEEELKALSEKIVERSMELMAKEIELDAMNKLIGEQAEKLESEKKKLLQVISMKKRFEGQVKDIESKEKQCEGHMKEFEPKEKEELVNELVSEKKHIESRLQELESKEKQFEGQKKEFQSKEEEFKGRVKVLESKEEEFESKEKQFEGRLKELELKENKFKVQVKEFKLKEKQFGRQVKGLESKMDKLDGLLKKPESTKKQYEALTEHIAEEKDLVAFYMDDQLNRTFGGTSLQLYTSEKTDGVESLYNGILVNLLESSDPSRIVLDMIQNPIFPLCKKGDNVVIIADYQILLLEQLMKISPNIEPCVKDEALKLALDMKANMKGKSKNSLVVLGFLLLLSNYGLVTSFDEDEVLELFAFVAQHKIAVELFGTLGFANKVSDFVENLIRRKQFVAAVRFSCAYNLADKNKLVDLLQEHVHNAKLICEGNCKKTNSIEIKDKARDQEIASLRTVLQCILDHNLQSENLLDKEIEYRILELKAHKGH